MPVCWKPRPASDQLSRHHSPAGRDQRGYDLKAVAYDRAFIKTFTTQCDEEGVSLPLEEFGQGYVSMTPAVQLLEAAVLDKRIHHGGHPILRWQLSNVAIEMDPAATANPEEARHGPLDGA